MNRSKLIVLSILLLTITSAATAQPFHWGFKAGTNIYKFSGQSFQGGLRFGYSAGLYAEKQLVGRLGIQPELLKLLVKPRINSIGFTRAPASSR
jgi:hypothetical protein